MAFPNLPRSLATLILGGLLAGCGDSPRPSEATASSPTVSGTDRGGARQDQPAETSADIVMDMATRTPQRPPAPTEPPPFEAATEVTEPVSSTTTQDLQTVASQETSQLVSQLTTLNLEGGEFTAESAEQWSQNLAALAQQGADAVPAIRDFLAKNQDIDLDSFAGGDALGFSSLRIAMFDALRNIDGPEAEQLMAEILQNTAEPKEIAILANDLSARSPGVYDDEILSAARTALDTLAQGDLSQYDVAPVFEVLQTFGDENMADYLTESGSKWRYYSRIALSELPDGQGIPSLVGLAENRNDSFATLMLGQMAPDYPEAQAAIVNQIKEDRISEFTWLNLSRVLSGRTIQINELLPNGDTAIGNQPGLNSWHINGSNQSYYMLPLPSDPDSIAQRQQFIDDLGQYATSPTARAGLEEAKRLIAEAGALP